MKRLLLSAIFGLLFYSSFAQSAEEQQAMSLYQNGKKAEAAAAFEQIVSAKPSNINAINALAAIYLDLGKNLEAYNVSSRGLEIDKNNDNLGINKARAAIGIGRAHEAFALMDACIARDAGFFMPYLIKGNALDAQDKIQLAIGMYGKAIQLNPNFPNAYLYRGNDFLAISRYPQAIADYDRAIALEPESSEAFNMRGVANYQLGRYDEAIADYTKAMALGNFDALTNRGVAYKEQGKNEVAKADFNRAISARPKSANEAYFNLADLSKQEQKYDDALIYITKAVDTRPNSVTYLASKASILLSLKKDSEALVLADKILALDAKNRDGFLLKTTALNNLKRYEEAISTISSGIDAHPDFYLMYSLRGFVYKLMGKTALAAADNARAKELGVKN